MVFARQLLQTRSLQNTRWLFLIILPLSWAILQMCLSSIKLSEIIFAYSNITQRDQWNVLFRQSTNPPTEAPTRINFPRGEIVHEMNSSATKCIPNSCPNNMCSGDGTPRIPGLSIQDDHTMTKMSTFVSQNWGNVLSPYWAARAMAEIGGYQYKGRSFGHGTWMEFLPTYAPARISLPNLFHQICSRCNYYEYFHRGECSEGWSHIAPAIMNETQRAILEYSKRAAKEENDQIFNFFGLNDWLVYNRCCVFNHIEFAPGVLRTFDLIPAKGSFHVYIMMGRNEDQFSFCKTIVDESVEYMKKRNAAINVTFLDQSSLYVDFSRLVFAPNVLVAGMGSSWALWSAVLANSNNVVAHANMWSNVSMLPNHVTYLLDVPTLLMPMEFEGAPETYGIELIEGKFSNSTEDREKVMNYFRGVTGSKVMHLLGNHT